MRLSLSSALVLFVILVLASALPTVSAGRGDADTEDIAFQRRTERMLAEHELRLNSNDEFHRDIRNARGEERIARLEESQAISTRLQFAILVAVLGLLFRDFITVFRKRNEPTRPD